MKKKKSRWASIYIWAFRSTMAVLTVAMCALLIAAGYSDCINPNSWIIPSFLGIAFGVLLVAGWIWVVVLALTRRWRGLAVMAVTMLIVFFPARRLFPLHFGHGNEPVTRSDSGREIEHIDRLKLLSYNTCLMGHAKLNDSKQPMPVLDVIRESGADIVCLQEYSYSAQKNGYTLDVLRRKLKDLYPHFDFTPYSYNRRSGIAVLSKYPIRKIDRIDHQKTGYIAAMYYQIETQHRTIGLVNMHLRSNKLAKEDRLLYDEMLGHFEADSLQRIRTGMMRSLANAWRHRANEVNMIYDYVRKHQPEDMPMLICGDMNDTPVSYSSHKLRSLGLTDTWQETGAGLGITYSEHRFWFRIDHIFHNDLIHALQMKVRRDVTLSDHYPIEATFQILPE